MWVAFKCIFHYGCTMLSYMSVEKPCRKKFQVINKKMWTTGIHTFDRSGSLFHEKYNYGDIYVVWYFEMILTLMLSIFLNMDSAKIHRRYAKALYCQSIWFEQDHWSALTPPVSIIIEGWLPWSISTGIHHQSARIHIKKGKILRVFLYLKWQ